jgi:hypothetical protein
VRHKPFLWRFLVIFTSFFLPTRPKTVGYRQSEDGCHTIIQAEAAELLGEQRLQGSDLSRPTGAAKPMWLQQIDYDPGNWANARRDYINRCRAADENRMENTVKL